MELPLVESEKNKTVPSYQPLWVTGTDTGVGKTLVASLLTRGLNAAYWKPVQSGLDNGMTDTQTVRSFTQLPPEHFVEERWVLQQPLSPHLAARLDGVHIERSDFSWPDRNRVNNPWLIIEGAGGVLVPLNERDLLIDLMSDLKAPVIVVSRSSLGTINHSLLTINTLIDRGLKVAGFIMNGDSNPENERIVEHYSGVPRLGSVHKLDTINPATLDAVWKESGIGERFLEVMRSHG